MEVERLIDENNSLKTRACSAEEAVHRLTGRVHSLEEQMVPKGQHVAPGEKEIGIVKRTLAQKTSEARELEEALESERVKAKHLRDRVNYLEDRAVHKLVSTNQTVAVGKRPTRTKAAVGINALSMSVGSGGGGSSHHSVAGGSRRGSTSSGAMESAAPGGGTPGHAGAASATLVAGTPRSSLLRQPSSIASPGGMARTAAAESAAATLRQENESLRSRLAASAPPPVPGSASFPATTTSSMVSVPRAELHELERALKDKTSQVLLLKSRYEHLEAKAGAERELYDRALVVLEEQNGQIREARVALSAAEGDSAALASRAKAGEAATVELSKTREEVRRLERMLTELCQSPFLAQSKDALSKREHVESVERELAGAKEAVTHLQHTVRAQHAELGAMRRDKAELMGALEAAKEEASKAKVEAEGATKGMAVLRERLALFSGVLGSMGGGMEANGDDMVGNIFSPEGSLAVPPEELERALTLVRRRMDGGLGGTGASLEESAGAEVSALKRKIAALNLAVVSGAREAERTEALLAAQTSIARDLAGEVSELSARLAAEAGGGRKRLAETESLAERRGVRIGVLEAQVRQLIARCKELSASRSEAQGQARASAAVAASASAGRGGGDHHHQFYGEGGGGDDNDTVISALSGEGRVGDDSLLGGGGEWGGVGAQDATDDSALVGVEFGPGENVLEVYIVGARLEPGAFGRTDTTFALLEFFDFESKASPLATGPNPMYNFSSQYTIPLTPFFLTHAARGGLGGGGGVGGGGGGGCVSIDIYAAAHGDTVLRGRASLPLHRLLGPATKCVYPALTLLGLDGAVLGTLHVEARVALSLDSVWQSLVASRLGEGPLLAAAVSSSRALEDSEGCGARDNGATATATTAAAAGGMAGEKRSGGGAVVGEDGGEGLTLPPPPSAKNTLTITLQAVQHLPNPLPRVYLSYSLPSLDASSAWDMASVLKGVTPTTSSLSTSPVFAYSRTFPCTTTPTLMAALAARGLLVSLFNADTGGEVASTHVSLAPLAQGVGVEGEFSLGGGGSTVSLKVALGGPLLLLDAGGVGGGGFEASGGALYHVSREDALALCAGGEVEGGKGVLHRTLGAMLLLEEGDWGALLDFKRRVERVAGWRDIVAARGVASQASSSSSSTGEGGVISAPELVAAFQASDPVGSWDAIAMASIFRSLTAIAGSLGGSGNGGGGGGVSLPTPSILVLLSPLNGGALGAAIGARQHLATLPYPTRSSLLTCLEDCAGEAVGGGASSLYPPPSTMPRGAFIKGLQRLGVKISSPGEGGRAPTPPNPPATVAQQERALAVAAAETLAVQETLSAAVAAALSATTALTGSGSSSSGGGGGGGGRGYEEEEEGGASDLSGDALDEGVAQESLQPLAVTHQVAATTASAAAAAAMTLGSDTTTIPTFSSHSGVPVGFETVTSLVLTVHSLTRATPLIASPLKGVSPLLAFQFPASSSGQWKPVMGVLRASPIATGSDATFDAWAKAPGSGKTFGVTTTFSLAAGSPLALHLASALSQGANPEDADISFTLMMEGGAPLAKAVFSLRDMLDTRSDATNLALPLQALPALSLGSETVADLVISLKGAKAVSAALGQ